MNRKSRLIILSVLGVLIAICLAVGFSKAYLEPVLSPGNSTEIHLNNCAKIVFKETSTAIKLTNMAPMDDELVLDKIKPYNFMITSTCEKGTSFNVYLGISASSNLALDNLKYGIKLKGNTDFNQTGKLSDLTDVKNNFSATELEQIASQNNSSILDLMNASVNFNHQKDYELYLWIDSEVSDINTMGKTFEANVLVKATGEYAKEKEQYVTISDYIKSLYTKDGENNLYYHDGLGDYENASLEAGDYSYRYAGGDYHLTQMALDNNYKSIYDIIPIILDSGEVHKNNYWWWTNDRNFYLAYNEDAKSKSLGTLFAQAIEAGYIQKNEVHNYVCFGSSESVCPKDSLYRIIGVYGDDGSRQVKLVKAGGANQKELGDEGSFYASWSHDGAYIGDVDYNRDIYYWNKEGASKQAVWLDSSLNTINLNTNFVNYLTDLEGGKWLEKIVDTTWQVGGMTYQNGYAKGSKIAYDYELGDNKNLLLTEPKKIGLMYVSDYYYAASEEYWDLMGNDDSKQDVSITQNSDYRAAIWDNWLWNGDTEWLITPKTEYETGGAFFVSFNGHVRTADVAVGHYTVRPSFYLNSDVKYISGDGSYSNPYVIE